MAKHTDILDQCPSCERVSRMPARYAVIDHRLAIVRECRCGNVLVEVVESYPIADAFVGAEVSHAH